MVSIEEVKINYVGGREAFKKVDARPSIPKEHFWDKINVFHARVHPWRAGCQCPQCEEYLYRLLLQSRD